MFRVALLAALAALVLPAAAEAHWDLATDGNPKITPGWYSPETVTAAVCPPDGAACTPVAWTDRAYLPGETAPGTTFEVRYADGRTERSPAWQGRVQSLGRPTITGRLVATGDALPVASAWAGGWGDDLSALQLAACRTATGTGCVSLPQISGCPVPCETVEDQTSVSYGGLAGIPMALSGRYLIATETREPRDRRGWPLASPALWGMRHEFALPAPTGVQSVSAPVGPLGLPGQTIIEPAPRTVSSVKLRARALRTKGRLTLGHIECTPWCKVSVKVSGGGRKARTTTFTVAGRKAITTPVRRGKLTVRVHVDGKLAANGRVSAR